MRVEISDSDKSGWIRETVIQEQTGERHFIYRHQETPFVVLSRDYMRKWWFYGDQNELHIFDSLSEAKGSALACARAIAEGRES